MSYIHTEQFSIRTSEINHNKSLHAYALIQLMQEASMQHTIGMKVSVWDMEAIQGGWVLLKMEVQFYHYPVLGQKVTVKTYPSGLDGYLPTEITLCMMIMTHYAPQQRPCGR